MKPMISSNGRRQVQYNSERRSVTEAEVISSETIVVELMSREKVSGALVSAEILSNISLAETPW